MNRRHVLKSLGLLSLASMSGQLFAAPTPGIPRFLLVFLRGGYDAAHLLVPVGSDFYYASRPTLAIARPGSATQAALPLDSDWGLHPALEASLFPHFAAGELAFVPFAGTPDLSRSHFETQDSIETGLAPGMRADVHSGFLNRLAGELCAVPAMSFTEQLPLVFRGRESIPNMALRTAIHPAMAAAQRTALQAMYRGSRFDTAVEEGFALNEEVQRQVLAGMDAAGRSALSARGFEGEARRIARLMREDYPLGFVDVGGWDTHVNQGGVTGYLASRFDELGQGLAAFAAEMGPVWKDTTVVVISEFGRTFRENGNRGTDHGHGSVYWVLGGRVAGGRIRGEQCVVSAATLFQNRDYPVLNDYRAVLGGLFGRLYGLSPERLQRVFPGVQASDIGVL